MKKKKAGKKPGSKNFQLVCMRCRIGVEVTAKDRDEAMRKACVAHDAFHESINSSCPNTILRFRLK